MGMTHVERFKTVCRGEKPDYVPIFGMPGAPGMAGGLMRKSYDYLVETGMPAEVGGVYELGGCVTNVEGWYQYWGTTGPTRGDFLPADPPKGFKRTKRVAGEWEIVESETGAVTRQVMDNDITYSMPEFLVYDVRDRKSWEFLRDRQTPGPLWPAEKIDEACRRMDRRGRPLYIGGVSTWGLLRGLMGPEAACTILYDDPELAHEMIDWHAWERRTYVFPLIERLRPEIIGCGEDCCYNHGMLISPKSFREFCAPVYREIGQIARDCGADMVAIDTDGNAMELVSLVEECGVNAIYPFEVKAGNDLFALRKRHPNFIFIGWLEKEFVNAGNGRMIRREIMSKVPPLLAKGRYFPNGDHGIQPMVTFENLCKFMTLLHEVCGNPEGEFPRIQPD
jgi:hypothetical protein